MLTSLFSKRGVMDAEVPVRRVTLALGIFFDGTGNNALTTQKWWRFFVNSTEISTASRQNPFQASCPNAFRGKRYASGELSRLLHQYLRVAGALRALILPGRNGFNRRFILRAWVHAWESLIASSGWVLAPENMA